MHRIKEGCPGCGACLGTCPVNAIVPADELAMTITPDCIDCGTCVNVCPVQLIEKVPESEIPNPKVGGKRSSQGDTENAKEGQ